MLFIFRYAFLFSSFDAVFAAMLRRRLFQFRLLIFTCRCCRHAMPLYFRFTLFIFC